MPLYRIAETVLDLARNAILIDTGVLIAAFWADETPEKSYVAQTLLEEGDYALLVPSAVVVEAWGWMVGGRDRIADGYELFTWLNSPGRATILPPCHPQLQLTQQIVQRLRIDCVDAMLAELATNITEQCDLRPAMPIATFDTGDFTRMFADRTLKLTIFDMNAFDLVDMDPFR